MWFKFFKIPIIGTLSRSINFSGENNVSSQKDKVTVLYVAHSMLQDVCVISQCSFPSEIFFEDNNTFIQGFTPIRIIAILFSIIAVVLTFPKSLNNWDIYQNFVFIYSVY